MSIYAGKMKNRPRHVYREVLNELEQQPDNSGYLTTLRNFIKRLIGSAKTGDFRKMKLVLPTVFHEFFSPAEIERETADLIKLRERRNARTRMIYPHCSEEFSLTPEFLDAAFDNTNFPLFDKKTRIYTIGSCFARNIATYLGEAGYNTGTFNLVEDINAPSANAQLLELAASKIGPRRWNYIKEWLVILGRDEDQWEAEDNNLDDLRAEISAARVVIITLGTTLDFRLPGEGGAITHPPKFLLANSEDPVSRESVTASMKSVGAALVPNNYHQTFSHIQRIKDAIRKINPDCWVIFTVSPVPLDIAQGAVTSIRSAIELDCISKSTIRAALASFMEIYGQEQDPRVLYFPSYEIVRWVGSMMNYPLFGAEDAASRHVSEQVLEAVYQTFLRRHGAPEGEVVR